jgi:uncharacterized membrane protein (TIGR02234 family)
MTARRELWLAVGLCLLGAVLAIWGSGRTWVTYDEGPGLTIEAFLATAQGTDIASAARPLGFVALAGVVALAATRRWGRLLVGLVVLAAGAGVVGDAAGALRAGIDTHRPSALGTSRGVCEAVVVDTAPEWAWVTILGGLLVVLGGLLVAVRGSRWGGLSSSYEAPGGAPEPPATDKGVWDALDRGDDPTT